MPPTANTGVETPTGDEAPTGAEPQDSPPAIEGGDAKPTKPEKGFADHPRWQEIIGQRNDARTELEAKDGRVKELEEQISKFNAEKPKESGRLSEDDYSQLEALYPELKKRIFEDARELEAQRLQAEKDQEEAQLVQDEKNRDAAEKIVGDIRENFPDDESWEDFRQFVDKTVKIYPNVGPTALFEDYKDRGLLPDKSGNISQSGGGKAPKESTSPVYRNEDYVAAAHRGLKEKGIK